MKRLLAIALVAAAAACSRDHAITQVNPPAGPTISVIFPGGTITASIASTNAQRLTGLMSVTALGANSGMLFAFGLNQVSPPNGFFMQDTPTPLSIAFIDSAKVVINVDEMAAETITPHYATRPYRYALEANKGWMTTHGVTAGTVVNFTLPAASVR